MKINTSIILLSFLLFFSSCDDTEDTVVKIRLLDTDSMAISGAEVTLFSQPEDSEIEEVGISNAAGEAVFDLSEYFSEGQLGLFVLNIEVIADTLENSSIIQVVPEEVNELTLTIQ